MELDQAAPRSTVIWWDICGALEFANVLQMTMNQICLFSAGLFESPIIGAWGVVSPFFSTSFNDIWVTFCDNSIWFLHILYIHVTMICFHVMICLHVTLKFFRIRQMTQTLFCRLVTSLTTEFYSHYSRLVSTRLELLPPMTTFPLHSF